VQTTQDEVVDDEWESAFDSFVLSFDENTTFWVMIFPCCGNEEVTASCWRRNGFLASSRYR